MSENKPENKDFDSNRYGLSQTAINNFDQKMGEILNPSYIPPENPVIAAANSLKKKIDQSNQRAKEAEERNLIDPLTGCYNEKYLTKFIGENFDSHRHHLQLGFAYIDVNNLKKINDTYGHQAGDELIKHSAVYLKKTFRKEDVVIHLHGDEFVVICHNHGEKDNFATSLPSAIKERVFSKPPESFIYHNKTISYNVAVGVAVFDRNQDGENLLTTLERSDFLMQTQKTEMKFGR